MKQINGPDHIWASLSGTATNFAGDFFLGKEVLLKEAFGVHTSHHLPVPFAFLCCIRIPTFLMQAFVLTLWGMIRVFQPILP